MGIDVPDVVRQKFEELKHSYDFCISLKRISNNFYVYRATTRWDRERKRVRSITQYLGKIDENGRFVRRASRRVGSAASAERESIDYDTSLPRQEKSCFVLDQTDCKLLTILSTNAKANLSHLGRKLGIHPPETYRRVKQLEEEFGIRYRAEITVSKFNYHKFFILVKFSNIAPTTQEILAATKDIPNIQLVQRLESKYNLLIYVLVRGHHEIATVRRKVRRTLGKYDSEWYAIPVNEHFNTIPLRDEFIEQCLKKRLLKREYAVLKELNANGTTEFNEIDRKYGFDEGRSLYTYHKLMQDGILRRVTMSMEKLNIKYTGIILEKVINYSKFDKSRIKAGMDVLAQPVGPTNRYAFVCNIENPNGVMLFVPVFQDGDLEKAKEHLYSIKRGISLNTLTVTETILGSLCFRRIDPYYTYAYEFMREVDKGPALKPMMDYFETGRGRQEDNSPVKELGVWGGMARKKVVISAKKGV